MRDNGGGMESHLLSNIIQMIFVFRHLNYGARCKGGPGLFVMGPHITRMLVCFHYTGAWGD